jgi:hypothetical protein
MEQDDELLVFRLLAYALVRRLDLRIECADRVYFELLAERALVNAWLAHHVPAGTLEKALAAGAAAIRAPLAAPAAA